MLANVLLSIDLKSNPKPLCISTQFALRFISDNPISFLKPSLRDIYCLYRVSNKFVLSLEANISSCNC